MDNTKKGSNLTKSNGIQESHTGNSGLEIMRLTETPQQPVSSVQQLTV